LSRTASNPNRAIGINLFIRRICRLIAGICLLPSFPLLLLSNIITSSLLSLSYRELLARMICSFGSAIRHLEASRTRLSFRGVRFFRFRFFLYFWMSRRAKKFKLSDEENKQYESNSEVSKSLIIACATWRTHFLRITRAPSLKMRTKSHAYRFLREGPI
jgi:hypothetical protein